MSDKTIGILLTIFTAFLLAFMAVLVRIAHQQSANISTILFMRFSIGLIALIPLLKLANQSPFKVNRLGLTVIRALAGTIAMLCFYTALIHLNLADTMMIQNTNPIYIPILVFLFLKVRTNFKTIIGIVISIIGTIVVINPHGNVLNPYALLAVAGAMLTAIAFVSLRQISKVNPTSSILFYFFAFATVTSGVLMFFGWKMPTLTGWLTMLAIGIIGLIYQTTLTKAMKYLPSRIVSPIMLSSVIFAGIFDAMFYNVLPNKITLIGMGITVIGIAIVVLCTKTRQAKTT